MNWRHDTWRKLYAREEGSFATLPYFARAVAAMLLKLVDDDGRIELGSADDLVDVIGFRQGADKGERRILRRVVPMLLADGYLEAEEGGRAYRIRNFRRAHPHAKSPAEPGANRASSGPGAGLIRASSGLDAGLVRARTGDEKQAKQPESLKTPSVVPDLPSVPVVPERGEIAPVPLSVPPRESDRPKAAAPAPRRWSAYELAQAFGKRFEAALGRPGWGVSPNAKITNFAAGMPDEYTDAVEATMDLAVAKIRDRAAGWERDELEKAAFALGAWAANFGELVAEVRKMPSRRATNVNAGTRIGDTLVAKTVAERERADACNFHRDTPERPSSEPVDWCPVCRRLGKRQRKDNAPASTVVTAVFGGGSKR